METGTSRSPHSRTADKLSAWRAGRKRWERPPRKAKSDRDLRADRDAAVWSGTGADEQTERDRLLLVRLVESIRRIEGYLRGGRVEFMQSAMIQDAVMWNLKLICHCAKRLSVTAREGHADIDWARLSTLIGSLAKNPWHLKPDQVWNCAGGELPALRLSFQAMLRTERAGR